MVLRKNRINAVVAFCAAMGCCALNAVEISVPASSQRGLTADELSALASADELVKTGAGTLTVGDELKEFGGIIRIAQGAYMVTTNGALGTVAGATYVSSGASLVLNGSVADTINLGMEPVHIAGAGTDSYPGAVCNAGKQQASAFKVLELDGDATLGILGDNGRFDVRDGTVTMNGHTLSINIVNEHRNISFTRTNLRGGGHIVVVDGRLQIEGTNAAGFSWEGDASNTLTVKSGAFLQRSESKSLIPWTLKLEKGAKISSIKDTMVGYPAGDDWAGPVEINGKQNETSVTGPYTDNAPLRFSGPVSGLGTFRWTQGWVMLSNPSNIFAGTWKCAKESANSRAGLVVESTGSVTTVAQSIVMNGGATLSLPADGPYQLPPLVFEGNRDLSVNGGSGTAVSLSKTGTGTLLLGGSVSVTGKTEIAGGLLKLTSRVPYGNPGLWHGIRYYTGEEQETCADALHARYLFKDNVTNSVFYAYQDRVQHGNAKGGCATFSGYVVNWSPTSEVWTVTSDIETGALFYLNEDNTAKQQFASTGRKYWNVTMLPGPNYIEWRLYRSDAYVPHADEIESGESWPKNFGIAYAVGADQTDPAVFRKFEDPGDGSLLVSDLVPRDERDASEWRASFDNVRLSGGAIDLDDREIVSTAKTLSGFGAISNGVFTVNKTWTLEAEDIAAGGIRFCNADVSFGAEMSFDTTSIDRMSIPDEGITFATVEDGEVKDFAGWASPDGWFTVGVEDGCLKLFKVKYGLKFVIR